MAGDRKDSIRALRDRALAARAQERHAVALEAFAELERLEPTEARWSRAVADCHERLGDTAARLDALERAAAGYAAAGFVVKAIAMCKLILAAAPGHRAALDALVELQGQRRTGLDRFGPRAATALRPGAALDDLRLRDVVPGAVRADDEVPGVYDIPLPPTSGASPFIDELAAAPLFARLAPASLRRVVDEVALLDVGAAAVIYECGAAADAMYVIVDGSVALLAGGPGSPQIASLGAGDVLGVIALCADERRPATAITLEPCRLLVLHREALSPLLADAPDLLEALLDLARQRLVAALLATHPLFSAFPPAERPALIDRFRFLEVGPGARLVTEGRPARLLYVVLTGALTLSAGGREVGVLGAGDVVGETSIATGAPAAVTVIATRKAFVLALARSDFLALAAGDPRFLDAVSREATARAERLASALRAGRVERDHLAIS